ncbi:MAG: hypothetical protein HYX28_10690 [Candidatus Koribacter versatilis]|uniref:Uncharacterized protein n=1 Tax=Candidatus Korobacter versatilis TaxID=658062 RepID=A0A932A9L1_9BACT|nr:hypothetical protein [Candidatus Koribacter versatilis]
MQLSHFTAALIFATFASIVFGITQRSTPREQVRYGLKCFAFFVLGTFLGAWVMWALRR